MKPKVSRGAGENMADDKESDDGARFRIKVLYLIVALLAVTVIWQNIRLGIIDGNLAYSGTGKADQYVVEQVKDRVSALENKIRYEIPAKYELTNLGSRVDNLATSQTYWQQNCLCR